MSKQRWRTKDHHDCSRYCALCHSWKSKDTKACCFRDFCSPYYLFQSRLLRCSIVLVTVLLLKKLKQLIVGLVREISASKESCGVVTPSNISPCAFVQAACDNNDVNEETLDGKNTTRAITLVLYQASEFGPRPPTIVHGDHSTKRWSLGILSPVQDILDCSAQGKRPAVNCFLNKSKEDWHSSAKPLLSSVKSMDSGWYLLRSSSSTLFDANITFRNPD